MNKYNNGKIYTIRCVEDPQLVYVGSTTQPLYKRFYEHKRAIQKLINRPLYKTMNEKGANLFYIELYENYSCNSIEELNKREGEIMREIATLNCNIAGRNKEEYYVDNKEKMNIKDRNYYKLHAEEIKQHKREYREKMTQEQKQAIKDRKREKISCECGCMIARSDIAKHKKTQKHKDLLNI